MDAVVQLLRNLLCCFKDLAVFEGTILHDVSVTNMYLGPLPEPLNKTTPLEVIISITQFYPVIFVTWGGIKLLTTSIGKLRRLEHLAKLSSKVFSQELSPAERIVSESLYKETRMAIRSAFIGFLVFPLGICFIWLTANSWHITETNWIGGLPALIYALTLMEINLVPLLYYMVLDGFEMLEKSLNCRGLLDKIETGKLASEELDVFRYEFMTGWAPFWETGTSMFAEPDAKDEEKLQAEVKKVQESLDSWLVPKKNPKGGKGGKGGKAAKGAKEEKVRQGAMTEVKERLAHSIPKMRMEGLRELLYFVFNFIAFYGYLMGVLAYFFDDEPSQPYPVKSLKFFYTNEEADWTGNFMGDLMWTLEPMVILGSPYLISMYTPKKESDKVKSD